MKETTLKAALTLALAGAAAYFRALAAPLIVLAAVMALDYLTGMARAWVHAALSSRVGVRGIVRKLGCLCAVAVAVAVDYVLAGAAPGAGAALEHFNIFGLMVTVWLILNECVSILENLSAVGVPLPGFLTAAVKRLKEHTERRAGEADTASGPSDHLPLKGKADAASGPSDRLPLKGKAEKEAR